MPKIRIHGIFLTFVFLSGCSVGPRYKPPAPTLPCEWHSPMSKGMSTCSPDSILWWESLNDPTLNCLIKRAAANNYDLHIAAIRVLEAREERKGKEGDYYPHIDGSAGFGHLYFSRDALVNGLLKTALPRKPRSVKRNVDYFELGFDAEWELDFFGVTSHEIKALQAQVEASKESLCDIWVTLSAEVARNYVELRGFQARLNVIDKNIKAQRETVSLTQDLVTTGFISDVDLKQSQEQLYLLIAQRPLIKFSIDRAIFRLSILLGCAPGALYPELCPPICLPSLPCYKPIGVPSELLRRRPDIRKAERELAAATERVGSAIAALFPRISLQGFIGQISTQLHSLLNPAATTWFLGPQLLTPIFNSRLLQQDVVYNKLKVRQACFEYKKTVLGALEEAENSIAAFHYELERNCALAKAQQLDIEAYQLMKDLYQKGFKDYLAVLLTTRSLLSTEDAYIQSQIDLLLHYIALYKALGGGWSPCNPLCQ